MNPIPKIELQGFTLVELAIVLFILALLLGGLLAPMAVQVEQSERRETRNSMEEIREAIYGFTLREGRLPCPDCRNAADGDCSDGVVNNGIEDRVGAVDEEVCRTEVGNVPWATLGVSGADAWGRRFTYRVDGRFADDEDGTGASCPETPGISFELCAPDPSGPFNYIRVEDGDGNMVADFIPAIIVSHGKNPEFRSDFELQNSGYDPDGNIFIDRPISQQDGQEFDDILVWISPHQLRTKMLRAGLLP